MIHKKVFHNNYDGRENSNWLQVKMLMKNVLDLNEKQKIFSFVWRV